MQTRREFLRAGCAAAAAVAGLLPYESFLAAESDKLGATLPRRVLLRNGEKTTAFGLGGFHVGKADDPQQAQQLLEKALDLGVRFFDNARGYQHGRAEEYYGRFLTPLYRDQVFITTKTGSAGADAMRRDLEASLSALKTDHLDLWQMHAIGNRADVDRRLQGGALDELLKAKAEGKTRYIGFTGHENPAGHLYLLQKIRELGVELDTVQMPLNLCDPHYESFQRHVLPELLARKYGVLAMKTMAGGSMMGKLIDTTPKDIAEKGIPPVDREAGISLADMHRYVYGLPASVLISGCESVAELEDNVRVLRDFHPLSEPETARLLSATKPYAGNVVENYKRPVAD
jgi:aryl-alcohol dehydrogenase-like predicted oxidoreductase